MPVQQGHLVRFSGTARDVPGGRGAAARSGVLHAPQQRLGHFLPYLDGFKEGRVSPASLPKARRSISVLLEPAMQYILAEMRRARVMRIDETPCEYRKRKSGSSAPAGSA